MKQRFVGLDFGGTSVKGGAVDETGHVLDQRSVPVRSELGSQSLLDSVAEMARSLGATDALGVGCAGLIDRESGVILESPNLGLLAKVALRAELATRLGMASERVVLENDANVAALGEQWVGAARGVPDFLIVTLGTGIGGGIMLGGALYAGPTGSAGEIGHIRIAPEGRICGCGARGCLETLASATACRRRASELGLPAGDPGNLEQLTAEARARAGPERALLFEVGRDLGLGLGYAVALLDLSCFVFAGGFAAALDQLEPGIRASLDERRFGERQVLLRPATLGGSSGWIGAARLVRDGDPS